MQLRINGKIGKLDDAKLMLDTKAKTNKQKSNLKQWHKSVDEKLANGRERLFVKMLGHDEILIDTYIGTDKEYEIHYELLMLERLSNRIDSPEYLEQMDKVNDLLKGWLYASKN